MKILDQAVLSAAEARPSVTEWECSLEDWLTAGHPGDARKYLVRDGNVELRPSRDCPRGEIRPREAKPPKCAHRWIILPYHYECYRPAGHIGLCVAANGVEIPVPTDPAPEAKCEWCGTRKNGSNRCCGEELRQRNGELSENIIKLQGDLRLAMTCSAVTNGPLGPIRCERLRGDDHGQKHGGGGREWDDDFSGPEFDCDECKEKDAEIARLNAALGKPENWPMAALNETNELRKKLADSEHHNEDVVLAHGRLVTQVVGLERELRALRAGIIASQETILRDRRYGR